MNRKYLELELRDLPSSVRLWLAPFLRPIYQALRNPGRLLTEPATTLERLASELDHIAGRRPASPADWRELVKAVLELKAFDTGINPLLEKQRNQLLGNPLTELLLSLAEQAEQVESGVTFRCDLPGPYQKPIQMFELVELRQRIPTTFGEKQALSLLNFASKTAELMYQPYARFLLTLLWTIKPELRQKKFPNSFGSVLRAVAQIVRDEQSSVLIEPRAAHIRNAAAHGGYIYLPGKRVLELHDRNWRAEFSLPTLKAISDHLWATTTSAHTDVMHYLTMARAADAVPAVLAALNAFAEGDQGGANRADLEANSRLIPS